MKLQGGCNTFAPAFFAALIFPKITRNHLFLRPLFPTRANLLLHALSAFILHHSTIFKPHSTFFPFPTSASTVHSLFVLVVVGSCSYRMEILVFFRSPKSNSNIPLFDSASQSLGLLASPWVASTLKGRLLDSRLRLKLSFLQLQLNTTTTLTTTIYSNITKYPPTQSSAKLRPQKLQIPMPRAVVISNRV